MRCKTHFYLTIACTLSLAALAQQAETNITLNLRGADSFSAWLSISNTAATNFLVEVSTDLRGWKRLLSVDARKPTVDVVDRNDPKDTNWMRFYRARVPGISVEDQQVGWAATGITNYSYRFTRLCFCRPGILSGTVTVQDGMVVGVTNAFDGQISLDNSDFSQFKSVEQLFEVIRQAKLQQADTIAIKYDAVLGFPADIRLDFLAGAVDDEIEYEASDLEAIK